MSPSPSYIHSREEEALRMAPSSPGSLLKTWFRAVRKHPSASEDLPDLGDPKHPLSTEPSPTRWTVTAQGAHPDAHTWKNSQVIWASLQTGLGGLVLPIQDGSLALRWPSTDLDRGQASSRGQWQDRLLQGGMEEREK